MKSTFTWIQLRVLLFKSDEMDAMQHIERIPNNKLVEEFSSSMEHENTKT